MTILRIQVLMHSKLFPFLCLLLALQSILANASSGHNLRLLNAQDQQHVLVICTGNGTKWINSDIYFETGKIVEVDQPSDIDDNDLRLACFSSLFYDHKPSALDYVSLTIKEFNPPFEQIKLAANGFWLTPEFILPALRAPPVSLLTLILP